MIVGVTGFFCSGKDTLAAVLQAKGFEHISLSDMLREELRERGEAITIANLTRVGNELRREAGPGVLAARALERMDYARNWVVTSIRHPAEIANLRQRPDFVMVFVEADQRLRFERSLSRGREGDPPTFEDFAAAEDQQMRPEGGDPAAQALAACRELADDRIENNATLEEFRERVVKFLGRALFEYFLPRPSWDEYFMMMAEVAAMRGNCVKRRVGAVIVLERQILSTGYNGTPKGITNCCDGGCPRGSSVADSGGSLEACLGVHAEENALIQAAAHGVRIRGATLYCTLCPCSYCAKSIINAGIAEVVYRDVYAMDDVTARLFQEAGVKLRRMDPAEVSVHPRYARRERGRAPLRQGLLEI